MQVKLLRALQESEFERVGGIKTIRVDVRLVAATNRDLKKLIAAGIFREDLFYRLNVVPIRLPALRERGSDIPLLVEHFLTKFNERLKKHVTGAEPEALEALAGYGWPGNIRESSENVIERAVLFCDSARDARHRFAERRARRHARRPMHHRDPVSDVDLQAGARERGGPQGTREGRDEPPREGPRVSRALGQTGAAT